MESLSGIRGKFLCTLFLTALIASSVTAHPLCIDKTLPKKQATPLSFCSNQAYSDYGCCNTEKDNELKGIIDAMSITNEACYASMKEVLCAQCDKYSAHLFGAEGNLTVAKPAALHPYLCSTTSNVSSAPYCRTFYQTCGNVSITGSPFSATGSIATMIESTYSSATEFCDGHQNPNGLTEGFCFDGKAYELPGPSQVYPPGPGICLDQIASRSYVDFVPHPDGSPRAFLTSKDGYIYLVNLPVEGTAEMIDETTAPFLNISSLVLSDGEFGLIGLAFHPKFLTNGKFYVSYSCDSEADPENCKDFVKACDVANLTCSQAKLEAYAATGGYGTGYFRNATVIAEYLVKSTNIANATAADVTASRRILTYGQPFNNHKAGQIHFGPLDGFLYIQFGDGGGKGDPFNFAQNRDVLLGKILRIDVDDTPIGSKVLYGQYGLPLTNPYFSEAKTGTVRGEIFASGFRNPRRCSFDRERPSYFFCGDSGLDSIQEVNLVSNGGNYGWRLLEGKEPILDLDPVTSAVNLTLTGNEVAPILIYDESSNVNAIGGFMSRSTKDACLFGRYLFADYSGKFYAANENPTNSGLFTNFAKLSPKCATGSPIACSTVQWDNSNMQVVGWGEDNSGTLYVLSSNGIFRMASPSRCGLTCTQTITSPIGSPLSSPSPLTPSALSPTASELSPTTSPSESPSNEPVLETLPKSTDKEDSKTLETWLIFAGVAVIWILAILGCCLMGYFRYNHRKPVQILPILQQEEDPLEYEQKVGRLPSEYYESETGEDDESYNSKGGIRRVFSRPQSQDI